MLSFSFCERKYDTGGRINRASNSEHFSKHTHDISDQGKNRKKKNTKKLCKKNRYGKHKNVTICN